jgi:ribosomal protein S18 acetylase RimI-like enzyme
MAFLGRSDLGSEYPRRAFASRIGALLGNADVCARARTESGLLVGVCLGLTDFAYFLFLTDLGVDRQFERQGIGRELVRLAHEAAGGPADISVITWANSKVASFYAACGMRRLDWAVGRDATDWDLPAAGPRPEGT